MKSPLEVTHRVVTQTYGACTGKHLNSSSIQKEVDQLLLQAQMFGHTACLVCFISFYHSKFSSVSNCLEIRAGHRPYHLLEMNDVAAMKAISRGNVPALPQRAAKDLNDDLWKIMSECWQNQPENKPSIGQVTNKLKQKAPTRSITGATSTG
jgi:hypothetical protein